MGRDLDHGMLPLWNPYLFSGTPCSAGFNAGAAYPATWLMAVLPVFVAWTLNLALAYDVALAGMYLFLRRQSVSTAAAATFGAATFAFAGYMTAQIVHIDLIEGAAVAAVDVAGRARPDRADRAQVGESAAAAGRPAGGPGRMWVALLAVSLGLSVLSGGVEAVIDGGVLVLIYGVAGWWRMGYLAGERP